MELGDDSILVGSTALSALAFLSLSSLLSFLSATLIAPIVTRRSETMGLIGWAWSRGGGRRVASHSASDSDRPQQTKRGNAFHADRVIHTSSLLILLALTRRFALPHLHPAYATFQALQSQSDAQVQKWTTFWSEHRRSQTIAFALVDCMLGRVRESC